MLIATVFVVIAVSVSYSVWLASSIGEGTATQTLQAPGVGSDAPDQSAAEGPRLTADVLRDRLRSSSAWVAVGVIALAGLAFSTMVIWLGLALNAIGLAALGLLVIVPLRHFSSTRDIGDVLLSVLVLTASFSVLIRAIRAALSTNHPALAIARNVLDEAVRMKVGLVFIIALILLLAVLPETLNESQPLRYRVQSFLQYSTTITFWVLATLTLFFSVSTVAFEQRDRLIWQTMVKPVSPAVYLLGKWVGVMMLNLALLSVSATGVFIFVEHLRKQPALQEVRPYLLTDGRPGISPDRMMLETQVLSARASVGIDPIRIDDARLDEAIQRQLNEAIQRDFTLRDDPQLQRQFALEARSALLKEAEQRYRSVPPGGRSIFVFSGLGGARSLSRPLMVRYRVNAGGVSASDHLYRMVFVSREGVVKQQSPLGITQTFIIPPQAIDEDGRLQLDVINGDPELGAANPLTVTFPPNGFEVLYAAGGYEANFFRVAATLWVKLGFIASVGVASATFLSFPVAALLTFLVLFVGESAGFLQGSLEEFVVVDRDGKFHLGVLIAKSIATPIAAAFGVYSDLRPTAKLVDGRLVAWSDVARGVLVIGIWSATAYAFGWMIFRKRELAIYSGH